MARKRKRTKSGVGNSFPTPYEQPDAMFVPVAPKEEEIEKEIVVKMEPRVEEVELKVKVASDLPTPTPTPPLTIPPVDPLTAAVLALAEGMKVMSEGIDKMADHINSRLNAIEHQQSVIAEQQTLADQSGLGMLGLESQGGSDQRSLSTLPQNKSVESAVALTLADPNDEITNRDPEHIVIVGAISSEEIQRRRDISDQIRNNPERWG